MKGRNKLLVLAAASVLMTAGAGAALAEPPGGHAYRSGGSKHRLHHGKRDVARGHVVNHRGYRAGHKAYRRGHRVRHHRGHYSRGRYYAGPKRHHHAYWYPMRHHYGKRHYRRHHRHIDVGAVVAGLVLGGIVYEILDGDRNDDYYDYRYYED